MIVGRAYTASMRRWLCLFLLVCFPLQLSWAVAATYCQHEQGADAHHFGHHQHQHHHAGAAADASASAAHAPPQADAQQPGDVSAKLTLDSDCAFCHLGSLQPPSIPLPPVLAAPGHALVPHASLPLASHIPAGPERPDRHLAA